MNCYEIIKITALLTVIFGVMCLPEPCSGAVPQYRLSAVDRKAARIARLPATPADLVRSDDIHCIAATSAVERQQLYYLRNRCSHGFVSVDERRKVIVQETGLDSEHPAAGIIKEVCSRRNNDEKENLQQFTADLHPEAWKRRLRRINSDVIVAVSETAGSGGQFVRYRHHESKRYVCFDRRGRVRAVMARKVAKRGLLCMFVEQDVDRSFHTIQSAYDPTWHLAFSYRRAYRMKYTGEKVMPSKRGFAANRMSCEAQFHSGHPAASTQPHNTNNPFSGIFNQISKDTISSHSQQYSQKNTELSSSRSSSDSSSKITVNLAVEIKDDVKKNEDEKNKDDITQQSADSQQQQLMNAYEQHPVVRLQNAWAFAAKSAVAAQHEKLEALTSNIIDNISKPKIRHFAKKRPRLSRHEKNLLKKKKRRGRGGSARKFKPMNSA